MELFRKDKFYLSYLIGIFLILLLPLLSVPPLFHPGPWAKAIGLRILFSCLIFVFILEIFSRKNVIAKIKEKLKNKSTKIPLLLLTGLFFIFGLANIFSLNPHFSFWGNPYRGGGFLTFGYCILFAFFCFLILKEKHWQKAIDLTILVGGVVALIAVFQKFALFSDYLAGYDWRPVSTMGGPIFLALYLALLSFLPLSLGIKTKSKKRIFYFIIFFLMILGILLTGTRAAFLGMAIGVLFFFFFYPSKDRKWLYLKLGLIGIIVLSIVGFFWLKTQPALTENLKENRLIGTSFERVWSGIGEESILDLLARSRIGGWTIMWRGMQDRPLLGYGPENQSISFDKHFDTKLPGITSSNPSGVGAWWDRGHNFIFDIGTQAGWLAVIVYLLLFGSVFYKLQKTKKSDIICHGIQATFIAYLATNFFSFDVTSTWLLSFFLIGYSLFLISRNDSSEINIEPKRPTLFSYMIATGLLFFLIWFIWQYNILPLKVNEELNQATYLDGLVVQEYRLRDSQTAKLNYLKILERLETASQESTFIDNYFNLKYVDIISTGATEVMTESTLDLSRKAVDLLEKSKDMSPSYTRIWIYLAFFNNKIVASLPLGSPEAEELNQKIEGYIEKAKELSPKRPDAPYILARNKLVNEKYEEALQISEECIEMAPEYGNCYISKGLALIGLEKVAEGAEYIEKGSEFKEGREARAILSQVISVYSKLAKATGKTEHYEALRDAYIKKIAIDPSDFQDHASLAFVYAFLGDYEKAKEEAMMVLELSPESKANVEAFLKTLP